MSRALAAAMLGALCVACSGGEGTIDAGRDSDAASPRDAMVPVDARVPIDARIVPDARGGTDAATPEALSALRDALFGTFTDTPCETWASLDASRRAVFLMITHRLSTSRTPDGRSMLAHLTRLYLVLGGGSDGTTCGGAENNRLFLAMDPYLWERMVETWDGADVIQDGSGSHWLNTRDAAGPHDPFDASNETDIGLRCTLLFETSESRPPTAQAHFFQAGSAAPVERGSGISLPADPYMLEVDHDFDCIHRSNPTCSDFEDRYRDNHGDFECEWVPSACVAEGTGCYRSARSP